MIHNVAVSNTNFVDKKPNGYSFADFMGKKLFQTLRYIKDMDQVDIARNGGQEIVASFVSKENFEANIDTESVEMTDDLLSQVFPKVVAETLKTKAIKIVSTKAYSMGVDVIEPEVRGYLIGVS